ncbi:hypothetical protein [Fuscovulum blasticum]|uniref:hypothetical protein n=1 Tax=Fuscovulum blasticum TaxID=1075 RepID=UPI000D3E9F32|nr:hypothetical protein [Fuscovulum blasticum]AWD22993.1 hypothetical protein B6K69_16025 [Fuscovulum blasticum]
MALRSTRFMVTFRHPFSLPGDAARLPAGDYEILVEEELLQGLTFEAYRRTASFLVAGSAKTGRTEMYPVSEHDLQGMLTRDQAPDVDGIALLTESR